MTVNFKSLHVAKADFKTVEVSHDCTNISTIIDMPSSQILERASENLQPNTKENANSSQPFLINSSGPDYEKSNIAKRLLVDDAKKNNSVDVIEVIDGNNKTSISPNDIDTDNRDSTATKVNISTTDIDTGIQSKIKRSHSAKELFTKGFKKTGKACGSVLADFKTFIQRGNVIDLAVGIVIGSAFTAIVNSIVTDLISPIIGVITDKNLENMFVIFHCRPNSNMSCVQWAGAGRPYNTIAQAAADGAVTWNYGSFIDKCINFFIISIVVFCLVKTSGLFKPPTPPKEKTCLMCCEKVNRLAKICKFCKYEFPVDKDDTAKKLTKAPPILKHLKRAFSKSRIDSK